MVQRTLNQHYFQRRKKGTTKNEGHNMLLYQMCTLHTTEQVAWASLVVFRDLV